jgi:hypothetical protein
MGGPAWLAAIFAAASLAVAVYCAGRLVVARGWHRLTELDTDGAHVVMGVAMAGMLVSGLRPSRRQRQPRHGNRTPLPRPPLRRHLQDRHGDHHGLHADPDALTHGAVTFPER